MPNLKIKQPKTFISTNHNPAQAAMRLSTVLTGFR